MDPTRARWLLGGQAATDADHNASLGAIETVYEFVLAPGELALIPERWAHAVHNIDDTLALTYNFVDEANLRCYLDSMRSKVGGLLVKLLGQLAQGRGLADAARAFSQHSALAYFFHLIGVAHSLSAADAPSGQTPKVTLDDERFRSEAFLYPNPP